MKPIRGFMIAFHVYWVKKGDLELVAYFCTILCTLAIIFIKVPPQQNEHIEFKFAFKKNVISTIVNFVRSKIHKNYQHTV